MEDSGSFNTKKNVTASVVEFIEMLSPLKTSAQYPTVADKLALAVSLGQSYLVSTDLVLKGALATQSKKWTDQRCNRFISVFNIVAPKSRSSKNEVLAQLLQKEILKLR